MSASYTIRTDGATAALTSACRTPSAGISIPTAAETAHPLPQPRPQALPGRLDGHGPRRRGLERRCLGRRCQRRRVARPLRAQHAGGRPLLREPERGRSSSRRPRQIFPEDPVGHDGDQVLRLRQRRQARPALDRHALGHERGRSGPTARSSSRRCSGRTSSSRGAPTSSSSATRSSTTSATAKFVEVSDRDRRRELLALGAERRRSQRGRLGRRLHRVVA